MSGRTRADVAVVGLGAMGSLTAWRLAARGASVVGFDRYSPPHALGSSHGDSRVVRTAYFEDPAYVPLAQRAFALWRELERASGASLLTEHGALMIGPRDGMLVQGVLTSARLYDLDHAVLDGAEMRRRYPQFRLRDGDVGVWERQGGFVRPEAAIGAALDLAATAGACLHRSRPVECIESDGDGVRLRVGGEVVEAGHAVVAAGPWLPALLPDLPVPLRVERQVLAWFPVADPAAFAPARFPVFGWETEPGKLRYGFPTLDGDTVKVAVHHEGAEATPDGLDREVHAADLAPIEAFVAGHLAGATPTARRGLVCMYTNTPDEHFLIGSPPGQPRLTVLSPCSGHGFKFASVIGDIAADLALAGRTEQPVDLFGFDRHLAREGSAR